MNINKIIKEASYTFLGTCIKMTYHYKQQNIDNYDMTGRPIFKYIDKKQVAYGVTKSECKRQARLNLMNEKYFQKRFVVRCEHQHHITDGLGVMI